MFIDLQKTESNHIIPFLFSEIASFECKIEYFAKLHDPDTRRWFFEDFNAWFNDPGDSRAYVLLGDPAVGKTVLAAVLAQQKAAAKDLGAVYFCGSHKDDTRNDPRYLLKTVAWQLCESNSEYNAILKEKDILGKLIGKSELGVTELFTKLLEEPLGECNRNHDQQRKLVIIDALDETKYESRKDFLDLIMHHFPLLPEWLVFFITSRPEDSVQFRLKKYNRCVKICAGNSDQHNFYQQHEQDIQTFLTKRIDLSRLPYSVEDMSKKCNGLFLYARYIVEELRPSEHSGKKFIKLSDLFPGNIDSFFLRNFTRVCDQVGQDLFKTLFGCAIVAPSPPPVSIISSILKREKSDQREQQVIDAVSQFLVLRTSDQTFTFLHNLIPAWLTDTNKASRELFIDKTIAVEYLRKMFVEILSNILNEPQPTCTSIDVDLKDYVSRVVVRFLCQYVERDSLEAVFSCLTSYHFIERRMLSGRIEIYHLIEDLKLAVSQLPFEEVNKQEILQDILFALESNVLVLLNCPHLLHSCIRNASKPVRETVLIPQVSAPWLEWNVHAFPDAKIADMKCFATSPNKRTVAGALGRSILFFDVSTAETVNGPFEVSNDLNDEIDQLEFSPDGKYIFFGRLNRWFSVERGCVEDFRQFSGNSRKYVWGVFTRDGQSIVVKRDFLSNPATCKAKSCLFNLLALWALKEIEESQDDEMTVSFCPQVQCREPGVQIECLLERLGMQAILNRTRQTPTSLQQGEDPGVGQTVVLYDTSCYYCCRLEALTDSSQESSLAAVRQLVIEIYPWIFNYQVWDLQTGMPVLQQVFSHDVQLNPFTYLCHVTCASSECGLKIGCSGIESALSVCNLAAVTAVCCALFGSFYFGHALELEWELDLLCSMKLELKRHLELKRELELVCERELELEREQGLEQVLESGSEPFQVWTRARKLELELKGLREINWKRMKKLRTWMHRQWFERLQYEREQRQEHMKLVMDLQLVWGLKHKLEREQVWQRERVQNLEWVVRSLELKWELEMARKRKWQRLVSTGLFKKFQNEAFKSGVYANVPKGFQDLVYDVDGSIFICVSPEVKWITEAGNLLKMRLLQTGKTEHTISKFTRFTFSNDELYFVYSCEGSLHALSLQTGAVLTSVTGCNLCYFARKRQLGYLFRSATEERVILLTNLFSPFKFLPLSSVKSSFVGDPIAAMFRSSDTVISVSSDSMITFWHVTNVAGKEGVHFVSKSSLKHSVKNCVLSSDGKLIAVHQGTKVELHSLPLSGGKCDYSVFESKCEFTVACFAFSADNTALFFCIENNRHNLHFYLWDIRKEDVTASFESPELLSVECCCLSSNEGDIILCGAYQIEIWEYDGSICYCRTRFAVEKPYNFVKFSQCIVSLDNQFLVCCIADVILVYNLNFSDIHSSKRVLHGHLGRVEFCQFLKVNRFLISYGVDGVVFLWDLNESKAVGFARITQRQDTILSMAVYSEEGRAVCFTSSGRVCMIKLCELKQNLSSSDSD